MINEMKAVIFDMDGVIIDSEPLWQRAEFEVFSSLGVHMTSEHCERTKYMATAEVTEFWFKKFPWENLSMQEAEQAVIDCVNQLIEKEGKEIKGAINTLKKIKSKGYKIGLATNSPHKIIQTVLNKLRISHYFNAITSAEQEKAKPDPAVYISTAIKLGIPPKQCIVVEDSYTGALAAKNAGMKVIALADENSNSQLIAIADMTIHSFDAFDLSILN
jgi:mannitol-1-/sugar-/sorbitol-6-/2-deoxyglucose-6-phosphatase